MKTRQWLIALGLALLAALAAAGMFLTRNAEEAELQNPHNSRRAPLVDERPLQTAQALTPLATDRAQMRFLRQALTLADHEVDLAFSDGLRDATEQMLHASPETRKLYAQVNTAQNTLQTDQDRLDGLKKQLATARATAKDRIQQEIDLTQAQVELDQDELDNARGELIRSGADPKSRIQRQFTRHEAQQHAAETAQANSQAPLPAGVTYPANLLAQFAAWNSMHNAASQIRSAQNDAGQAAATLKQQHDDLDQRTSPQSATQQAPPGEARPSGAAPDDAGAALASLHQLSAKQKDLADLDKRIQDEQSLADAYGSWLALIQSRQIATIHGALRSALWIVLVLLALYLVSRLIDHFFSGLTADRTRLRTLRVVLRFAAQALAVLGILLVIFGIPSQMTTILGLAGAGLTIALKDFIVAFFGWFVLMGRNGIRVGDWVEIEGVGGEVVEIGLLRTVLLETGNWTDAGHPTGRKVAFVNSFAVEGHYFNFSTSGQWLWDELQVKVPAGENPYPVIEGVQKLVAEMTAKDANQAEQEWQRATTREHRVHNFSAAPAIEVRPAGDGVQILVRYITRAHERYDLRTRLYQAVVDLMHQKALPKANVESVSAADAG